MSSVQRTRRVVFRSGMLVLLAASLASGTAACIFDKSDYQGGGRSSQGAKTAQTATATDTTTSPTTTVPTGIPDAGSADGL